MVSSQYSTHPIKGIAFQLQQQVEFTYPYI